MNTFLSNARPDEAGLDPRRLQAACDLLRQWTTGADAPIPGAALLVGRRGKIVQNRFFGRMGPQADAAPVREDSMFLLASVTKPITYMGAMLLVERGLLHLSEPVIRYIPEFKAHGKESVLVGHLFTHTSGLPDMLANNLELRQQHAPLSQFIEAAILETKLLFKPGTQLSYQSMGTAVVAEIVQRISGLTIADFLRREIFEPLGLKSISLGSREFDRNRLVQGQVPEEQVGKDYNWNSEYWQKLGVPWGGIFSTSQNLGVICQVMLSLGRWGNAQLLSPASVRAMTTNRLDDYPDLPEPVRRCQPWGLGWQLNHPGLTDSWGDLLSRRVFGHYGVTGTLLWIDPDAEGFCVLLTSGLFAKNQSRLVRVSNAVASAFV